MPTLVDVLKYQLVLDDKQFIAGAQRADATADNLAGTIGGKLTTAVGLLAAAFGALKIGEFLKDATLTAARTEVLGTVLGVVGNNAGKSAGQIALLEEQVKALGITTQGARESIIRFIQSGLPLEQLGKLARTAQDAAIIGQKTTAESLDLLVRGIQTQQIELLRSAGVFVSIEQELNKFAKTAKRTAESLTPVEKQTIILNAVLAQGEKLAGTYGAAMGNVGKQMTSLPRLFEELQNAVGKFFLPAMEDAVEILSKLLKNVTDLVTAGEDLAAAEFLKSGGTEGNQIEVLNGLLARQAELREKILTIEKSLASLQDQPITADSYSDIKALSGYLSATNRALKETERLISAISENAFVGPIDQRTQIAAQEADALAARIAKREEERAKRALERGKELAKTITVGGDLAEGMDKAWAEILAGLDKIPLEFDYSKLDFDIKKIQQRIALGVEQAKLSPYGRISDTKPEELFDIRQIQGDLQDAAEKTQRDFEDAFRGAGQIASVVFRNLAGEISGIFDNVFSSFYDFISGNPLGGVAGLLDTALGFLSGGAQRDNSTARLIRSQNDLVDAIENWRNTIFDLSDRDRAERLQAAQSALALIDRAGGRTGAAQFSDARAILEAAGVDLSGVNNQQLLEYVRQILDDLGAITVSGREVVNATTAQTRQILIDQTRSANDANFLVRSFTDLFGISQEEQLALLESVITRLGDTLSTTEFVSLTTAIQELRDSIASGDTGPTQVERSIARVSERQADSLISIMSTIDLHLTDGLSTIIDYMQGLLDIGQQMVSGAAVGAGGNYTIEITNNFSGGNQAEIESTVSRAVEKGIRAVGGTRIGSR